jgi:hypothetical protein
VGNGWSDEVVEVQGADKEDEYHKLTKNKYQLTLAITKIDEKLAHNKKIHTSPQWITVDACFAGSVSTPAHSTPSR